MIKNPYPGKFIVFEGLDGSGSTTQVSKLRDWLNKIPKDFSFGKRSSNQSMTKLRRAYEKIQ